MAILVEVEPGLMTKMRLPLSDGEGKHFELDIERGILLFNDTKRN